MSAVLDEQGRPLDQVAVTGITGRGRHGVFADERALGQRFGADIVLHLDTRAAAAGDDLLLTVHYGEVAVAVAAVITGEPVALVETLAQRIADAALAWPTVVAVDVTVHKPQAPVTVPFEDVTVRIRRWRA